MPVARVLWCQLHLQRSNNCEYSEQRSYNCSSEGPYTSMMLSGQLPSRSLTTAASFRARCTCTQVPDAPAEVLRLRVRIPWCQIHQVVFLLRYSGQKSFDCPVSEWRPYSQQKSNDCLRTHLSMLYGARCSHAEVLRLQHRWYEQESYNCTSHEQESYNCSRSVTASSSAGSVPSSA